MTYIAAIQMASGPNVHANLTEAGRLLRMASERGIQVCVLPENFALMGMNEQDKINHAEVPGTGLIQDFLAASAARYGLWLIGGTIPLSAHESGESGKVRAACLVFDPSGTQVARYDKIHLFDVTLSEHPEDHYRESQTIAAGNNIVVLETSWGRLGLAVCYDLRFPELFRAM
jgi:deaminated glutathione amidase